MSGDVQPRKRKDKKKKKDELGIEEPRGTAAVFGEGDVFIHSYDEHGTGGHWCAKIIFFSLLAVLVTLIGLIILENRGLSELEANAVESRYSGVLEGWIEDDHHDEHTLELKHPDNLHADEDEEIEQDENSDDDDEHDEHDEDEHEEHDDDDNEEHDEEEDEVQQNSEENEDEIDEEDNADIAYSAYKMYEEQNNAVNDESGEDDEREKDDYKNEESYDEDDDDGDDNEYESNENDEKGEIQHNGDEIDNDDDTDEKWEQEEEHAEEDDDDDDDNEDVETLEKEISDEDILSAEVDEEDQAGDDNDDGDEDENDNQSEPVDDDDEPPVERITIPPPGKPYDEIEEESIQKTPDTLADEEEYERQQEGLKKQREAQSSHGIWLKLLVGGALVAATHAVVRRATAPRDEPEEEHINEDPSEIERRMTLIPETQAIPDIVRQVIPQEEIAQKTFSTVQSVPLPKPKPEVDKVVNVAKEEIEEKQQKDSRTEKEKELYSEEEEEEEEIDEDEEEEEEEVKEVVIKKPDVNETKAAPINKPKPVEEPPEEDEDVEIIDEEEIEEELEDEEEDEVEEEISDVDDADLLSRLETKYGRLPEPERPGRNKDGGNSVEEDWPGEPSDPYWSQQLDLAEEELRQGAWSSSERRASAPELRSSGRAQFVLAESLDSMAEAKRDNRLLSKAISAYMQLLKSSERLSDKRLVDVASRAIDRIQFRGTYLNAEPVYRLLIRRFPNNVHYRNNLTVSFLMANRADLANTVLEETLKVWPNDRIALAHYGFVLKNQYNKLEESVIYLKKALAGDAGAANEPRFYYHLGDALLQLGRIEEARQIHNRGAELGHFLSAEQRSLYNVPRLKSRPWWSVEATPYRKLVKDLENSWKAILKEGLAAKDLYEKEKEGLKEKGEWSQLDLFVRGQEIPGRCQRAPVTCSLVAKEPGARCRRGQIKFSSMEAGTHVRPHVGPTNCRLRMHLALSNTKDTFIRVGKEIRQWELGKVFIFDDSFEHEVWHNGTGSRLVLIVDVWHPDLTPNERRTLPAI